jgi:hypothetical protein
MSHVLDDNVASENRGGRRKFGEVEDITLVKEIVANDAPVCRRGKVAEKFEDVARALNEGNALPWNTNGKHCNDMYTLLLANFRRADRARALASGTEEEFGERDQLLADIHTAVNDNEERGRAEREISAKRDERLAKAGQEVRENAMRRKQGVRSDAESGKSDEEDDIAEQLTTSLGDEDMITPANSRRGRKERSTRLWSWRTCWQPLKKNAQCKSSCHSNRKMNVWASRKKEQKLTAGMKKRGWISWQHRHTYSVNSRVKERACS